MHRTRNHFVISSLALAVLVSSAACASDAEPEEPIAMQNESLGFQAARDFLATAASAHTASVMQRDSVTSIIVDELDFHHASENMFQLMEWHLASMGACSDASGERLDTGDAIEALHDLRRELEAHKVGMVTIVDPATALAAELAYSARHEPLFAELRSYCDNFTAIADQYSCAF